MKASVPELVFKCNTYGTAVVRSTEGGYNNDRIVSAAKIACCDIEKAYGRKLIGCPSFVRGEYGLEIIIAEDCACNRIVVGCVDGPQDIMVVAVNADISNNSLSAAAVLVKGDALGVSQVFIPGSIA